ncbi:MAG TPA: hypothetical protein VJ302_27820 [Blastocatellia bacterium]|nr:hypothetical protein [Blastocatellia bacterium]
MLKLWILVFTLGWSGTPALQAPAPTTTAVPQAPPEQPKPSLPLLHEFHGIKLGMTQQEVKSVLGKTSQKGKDWDEFKLDGDDLMTVRYDDQQHVKRIQLYFADPAHAPSWTEVVGQAQIEDRPNGSRYARADNVAENFWVTMFQSKNITTITLGR